jgi:hypothetical protein
LEIAWMAIIGTQQKKEEKKEGKKKKDLLQVLV